MRRRSGDLRLVVARLSLGIAAAMGASAIFPGHAQASKNSSQVCLVGLCVLPTPTQTVVSTPKPTASSGLLGQVTGTVNQITGTVNQITSPLPAPLNCLVNCPAGSTPAPVCLGTIVGGVCVLGGGPTAAPTPSTTQAPAPASGSGTNSPGGGVGSTDGSGTGSTQKLGSGAGAQSARLAAGSLAPPQGAHSFLGLDFAWAPWLMPLFIALDLVAVGLVVYVVRRAGVDRRVEQS